MRMTAFRIQNYRCIQDSGWVDIEDIAVIVGKNESGKTSLLRALWKFNPFHKAEYSLDREWPRGRRKERSGEKPVATLRFKLTDDEHRQLKAVHESAKKVDGVEITKNYQGTYLYTFTPTNPSSEHDVKWVVSLINETLGGEFPPNASDPFKTQSRSAIDAYIKAVTDGGGSVYAINESAALKTSIQSFAQSRYDTQACQVIVAQIDGMVAEIQKAPIHRVIDVVHGWLPVFVYMDDYRIFSGAAQLDEVKQRKDRNALSSEDETVMLIMEMAGLNLEEEVKKGNAEDREQRILDMNDAGQTLTADIAERWSQKKYEVMFQADGQHFITFVKDVDGKVLVPLEERSKGFQWFFSFDMTFMYETRGRFANAVILLDEPGLHLHAAAQRDLLKRMRAYAEKNQLVYTTHLPFMIDFTRLDNIFVAEDAGTGTKVHKDWATADRDARFTLQAALGMSWSQCLFVGNYNLIVEGVTDFWFLSTFSMMLKDAGLEGLDDQLVVTPAGGASKVAYIGTILHGQELKVAVLLDSDPEGATAYEQLVHQWILQDKHVLRLGDILGMKTMCVLEDLFGDDYYRQQCEAVYAAEIGKRPLKLMEDTSTSVIFKVADALKQRGVERFNKGRVAKRIMSDLATKRLSDLPVETTERFRKVVDAVNGIVAVWKQGV